MRILIKGAGDLASGIAVRLHHCGFDIIMTETKMPTTVRRMAAFSRAVYEADGTAVLEGITARCMMKAERTVEKSDLCVMRRQSVEEVENTIGQILGNREIAVIVDPKLQYMNAYHPDIVVDAILAKRNLGTKINDASLVIGVGPGFEAGCDCHYVIETMRGHDLGRVIAEGSAYPNTGVPGEVGGFSIERLIRASADGVFRPEAAIGDIVQKGQIVAYCGEAPVLAEMSGIVRGMLPDTGMFVKKGMKCGDIDARCELSHCFTVSDKARAVGGGVLEAIFRKFPVC